MTASDVPVGGGMHGGLNRFELNTTLIARGSGFAAAVQDDGPRGIIDIAPTVLSVLGLAAAERMTGRSLEHAIALDDASPMIETGQRSFRQWLKRADRRGSHILLGGGRA